MKTILLFVCALLTSFSLRAEDITLRDGKVLKGATVSKVDPSSISFSHDGGVARIPLENLTDEMLKQYGLNEQNANAFLENEAANKRKAAEQKKKEEAYRNLNMKSIVVGGEVLQALPDGALVNLEICHISWGDVWPNPEGLWGDKRDKILANHEYEKAIKAGGAIAVGEPVWVVQAKSVFVPHLRGTLDPPQVPGILYGRYQVVNTSHWEVRTIKLGVCFVEGLVNVKKDQNWGGIVWSIGTYTYTTVLQKENEVQKFTVRRTAAAIHYGVVPRNALILEDTGKTIEVRN